MRTRTYLRAGVRLAAVAVVATGFAGTQTVPAWHVEEVWRKGGAIDGPYYFDQMLTYRAAAIAPSPGSRLIVFDPAGSRLHLLDSTGALIRTIGREGSGPGEFRSPFGVAVAHDGRIVVNDLRNGRFVLFSATGDFDRVISIRRGPLFAFDIGWDASFDNSGRLLHPLSVRAIRPIAVTGVAPGSPLLDSTLVTERWARDLLRSDTVSMCGAPLPVAQNTAQHYMRSFGGSGRIDENAPPGGRPPGGVGWLPIPFTEQHTYYVRDRDGLEWAPIAPGSRELVRRAGGRCGDVVARVTLRGGRAPVPAAARERELAHVLAEVHARVPREYPWYRALRVDDQNQLWVERDVAGGRRFDVFSATGQPVAEVNVPAGLVTTLPVVVAGGRLHGFVKDANDVAYLVAWRIVRGRVSRKPSARDEP